MGLWRRLRDQRCGTSSRRGKRLRKPGSATARVSLDKLVGEQNVMSRCSQPEPVLASRARVCVCVCARARACVSLFFSLSLSLSVQAPAG